MTTTITALDGTSDTTSPILIDGWDPAVESGNIIHKLLAPGAIAVVLVGDLPRAGTLRLVYGSDVDAEAARALLARPSSFSLTDSRGAAVAMTFVRDGMLTATMYGTNGTWTFEVGYQEIQP